MQWGTQSSTFYPAKRLVFVGYSLTDEDFVHIYDLVRQRLADTPRRPYIVTLDERINGDTHPDAKVILTSGDRFLARIKSSSPSDTCSPTIAMTRSRSNCERSPVLVPNRPRSTA